MRRLFPEAGQARAARLGRFLHVHQRNDQSFRHQMCERIALPSREPKEEERYLDE